ncbi:LegC family aminotransferase [Gammaproteobacteria bacterium]|nr:LegC family aminotransferase [Gammaproteobacteria bacterium]|tara:strand:- start:267 stop:1409 length:1143 start_codon:yes stop_codon:yes gene_type:complete
MFESTVQFIQDKFQTKGLIPLHEPVFQGEEKSFLNKTIDSTFVSNVGEYVDQFEDTLAKYTGSPSSIAVMNGTSALHLSLLLAKVQSTDYVITQALTFVATCNAISYCGAEPIFVDVEQNTLSLSPVALQNFLEDKAFIDDMGICKFKENHRTIRACIPMHTFGHPADMDPIVSVCKKWNLFLIEDAAESLGSMYKNQHTGTLGSLGALSFNGNKIITSGGGGAVLCNHDFYLKGKHLSTTAKQADNINFYHDQIGYNFRMPNINAALGCAQLLRLDYFIDKKRKLADEYKKFFEGSSMQFFTEPENSRSNYWLNTIICEDQNHRNDFLEYSNSQKIMTRPAWTLMHKLPMYEDSITDSLENSIWLQERIVNIPSSATFV